MLLSANDWRQLQRLNYSQIAKKNDKTMATNRSKLQNYSQINKHCSLIKSKSDNQLCHRLASAVYDTSQATQTSPLGEQCLLK